MIQATHFCCYAIFGWLASEPGVCLRIRIYQVTAGRNPWKMHPPKIQTYRWWKKSCTTWDVYKPCGAGFLPSTVSWVWSPPSNSGIFRLPDLLQLELLWAHPVKRDEPTNAQLMYKYDDDKWTKEAQQSNTNRQNNHPPASAICVGYERHKPLGLRRVPRLVWKAFQRACWVRTAS